MSAGVAGLSATASRTLEDIGSRASSASTSPGVAGFLTTAPRTDPSPSCASSARISGAVAGSAAASRAYQSSSATSAAPSSVDVGSVGVDTVSSAGDEHAATQERCGDQ
jgi:hypothetical protein